MALRPPSVVPGTRPGLGRNVGGSCTQQYAAPSYMESTVEHPASAHTHCACRSTRRRYNPLDCQVKREDESPFPRPPAEPALTFGAGVMH